MNGTKPEDQGQSPVVTATEDDFDAIAKAVHEGNSAELDKLFEATPAPKDGEQVETPEEEEEVPTPVEEEVEEDDESEAAKAAAAAAIPAPTPDERDVEL